MRGGIDTQNALYYNRKYEFHINLILLQERIGFRCLQQKWFIGVIHSETVKRYAMIGKSRHGIAAERSAHRLQGAPEEDIPKVRPGAFCPKGR